jgi:hypothetical protein
VPEIGRAARTSFNPLRGGDRLAALSTGISKGQRTEVHAGHDTSPFFDFFESGWTGLLSDYDNSLGLDYEGALSLICERALILLNGEVR